MDLRKEVLGVECDFREKNDVRRVLGLIAALCNARSRRYPAGVSSHDFHNRNKVVVAHCFVVEGEFADGC